MRFGRSPVRNKKARAATGPSWSPQTRLLARQILIGFFIFSIVGGVFIVVWNVSRLPSLTITTITATGGETINPTEVVTAASSTLSGTYLKLVPRRFSWTYPKTDLLAAVGMVPRVKDPQVTRRSATELLITYEEYVPFALWCAPLGACQFIDEGGYAFAPAPALEGGSLTRYLTTDVQPERGITMPDGASVPRLEAFLTAIESTTPLAAETVEIDAMKDVFLTVAGGGEIKFSLEQDFTEVGENLQSILASEEFKDIKPGTFQYIDLRFGSKIFVNTELGTATTSSSTLHDIIEETLASTTALE